MNLADIPPCDTVIKRNELGPAVADADRLNANAAGLAVHIHAMSIRPQRDGDRERLVDYLSRIALDTATLLRQLQPLISPGEMVCYVCGDTGEMPGYELVDYGNGSARRPVTVDCPVCRPRQAPAGPAWNEQEIPY
jgi:hypothetical protein